MTFDKEKIIIISVGGSLVYPNGGIDVNFLKKFDIFIRKEVKKGKKFFLVVGAGKIGRHYIDAGKQIVGDITKEDLDWLAIHATRFNAQLIRTIFKDIANPRVIENYEHKLINWKEPVVVGAGWKPGWSTDYDATGLARDYNGKIIINLSNIYYVYDKDPVKFADAKKIKHLTWVEMEELMTKLLKGKNWSPGLNAPFDPIATKLAKKLGLKVIVTNGKDFENLANIIEGRKFKGTIITPTGNLS